MVSKSEFQVNTEITTAKSEPAVAALKDGGFVSVWSSENQDGSGIGVYGQRFDQNGMPVGSEFRVNTTTDKDQQEPSVAGLNSGGFVVTWTSYGQDVGDYKISRRGYEFIQDENGNTIGMEVVEVETEYDSAGVFGQRYSPDGTPVGNEFQVNTKAAGNQEVSKVAALGNGGFVVIWRAYLPYDPVGRFSSDAGSYSGNGVFARRWNSDGTPAGDEWKIADTDLVINTWPVVSALSNGGFVVVWNNFDNVTAQRYDGDGTPLGSRIQLGLPFVGNVAGLSQGGFVVTGTNREHSSLIQIKTYNSEGSLASDVKGNAAAPTSVTALSNGDYVVVRRAANDEDMTQLCAQRYDSVGTPVDSEFLLNQKVAVTKDFALTTLNNDRVVACWVGQGIGQGIESEPVNLIPTIEWLSSSQYDTGTFSGFDLDASGNCLETHVGGGRLYYRVGSINQDDKTISFGSSTRFANGTSTSVSLAEDGNFVEVHTSGGNLYSRVAQANFSSKTIEWKTDGTPYQQYDTGTYCSVVVDSQSNCLEIHTGSSGLYYRIGKVNYTSKTINWGAGSTLMSQGNYSQCSLTMDAEGNCVATVAGGGLIYAHVGKFSGNSVEWGESNQVDQGSLTSVALDGEGNCLETHSKDNRLYYCIGKVDSSTKTITTRSAIALNPTYKISDRTK